MATLEKVAHINDLSPKTRKLLNERISKLGRYVTYRFDIKRKNPDPEKYNGAYIVPSQYSLDPKKIEIFDDGHENGGRMITCGLVDRTDDKGVPDKFFYIKLYSYDRCEVNLDLTIPEERQKAMYLEIHPKNTNSMFPNSQIPSVFSRVDEAKESTANRTERSAKVAALNAAMNMSDAEILEFAAAMLWEDTDLGILRDKVEKEAESDPDKFKKLIDTKKVKYLAAIKKGIDKKKVIHNAAERSFSWNGNGGVMFICSEGSAKTHNEQFADWLMTEEQKAKDVYNKLIEMV